MRRWGCIRVCAVRLSVCPPSPRLSVCLFYGSESEGGREEVEEEEGVRESPLHLAALTLVHKWTSGTGGGGVLP